jgi:hypothetical protein
MKNYLLLKIGLCFVVLSNYVALGACNCWFPDYYVAYSNSVSEYDPLSNSDGHIDSCTFFGESPVEQ